MKSPHSSPETKRRGSVLIVGVGALGCAALGLLSRHPVAKLTFIDPDRVEPSNLPPQPLYDQRDIGKLKVTAAAERLAACGALLEPIADRLTASNAAPLVDSCEFVIDACDDPATKFLINRVGVNAGRRFCYAGLSRTGGLGLSVVPGVSACLACVFPEPDTVDTEQGIQGGFGCHETGITTPVAAVLGAYQALEATAALGLRPSRAAGRLAIYQLRGRRWQLIDFPRDPRCTVCTDASAESVGRRTSCHSSRG